MDMFATRPAGDLKFCDVLYEKKDMVARITINRPDVYNSYSTNTLRELIAAFDDASSDDGVGVIVLTGAGEKAFCTGGDVKEYATVYTQKPRDYFKYMGLFSRYIESILRSGKVTIARINGMAVGGGNESQLACDLAVMADDTYIAQVGTSVGSVACGGATQWLGLHVGDRRAREMLFLNPRIPATQALEWGLVNRVVPRDRLDAEVAAMAGQLLGMGCTQVSLGDTIGVGTPGQTRRILDLVLGKARPEQIALHMHDTRGTALANVLAGLEAGLTTFDSSIGGLGGCPYAPGASGNLATEDLVYMLQGMGCETGISFERLVAAGELAQRLVGRPLPGRALQAELAARAVRGARGSGNE